MPTCEAENEVDEWQSWDEKYRVERIGELSGFQAVLHQTASGLAKKCPALVAACARGSAIVSKGEGLHRQAELRDAMTSFGEMQTPEEQAAFIAAVSLPGLETTPLADLGKKLDEAVYTAVLIASGVGSQPTEKAESAQQTALLNAAQKLHKILNNHEPSTTRGALLEMAHPHVSLQIELGKDSPESLAKAQEGVPRSLHLQSLLQRCHDQTKPPAELKAKEWKPTEQMKAAMAAFESLRAEASTYIQETGSLLLNTCFESVMAGVASVELVVGHREKNDGKAIWARMLPKECSWEDMGKQLDKTLLKADYVAKVQKSANTLQEVTRDVRKQNSLWSGGGGLGVGLNVKKLKAPKASNNSMQSPGFGFWNGNPQRCALLCISRFFS